jgi:hypothetical protein
MVLDPSLAFVRDLRYSTLEIVHVGLFGVGGVIAHCQMRQSGPPMIEHFVCL